MCVTNRIKTVWKEMMTNTLDKNRPLNSKSKQTAQYDYFSKNKEYLPYVLGKNS